MDPLTREQILAQGLAHEDLEVPAWGRTVRLREMTLAERASFEIAVFASQATGDRLYSELLARCCTDPETGARIFTDEDAQPLAQTSARSVFHLRIPLVRLNGLTPEEAEDLGKAPGGAGGSTTSSPSASENPSPSSS